MDVVDEDDGASLVVDELAVVDVEALLVVELDADVVVDEDVVPADVELAVGDVSNVDVVADLPD